MLVAIDHMVVMVKQHSIWLVPWPTDTLTTLRLCCSPSQLGEWWTPEQRWHWYDMGPRKLMDTEPHLMLTSGCWAINSRFQNISSHGHSNTNEQLYCLAVPPRVTKNVLRQCHFHWISIINHGLTIIKPWLTISCNKSLGSGHGAPFNRHFSQLLFLPGAVRLMGAPVVVPPQDVVTDKPLCGWWTTVSTANCGTQRRLIEIRPQKLVINSGNFDRTCSRSRNPQTHRWALEIM